MLEEFAKENRLLYQNMGGVTHFPENRMHPSTIDLSSFLEITKIHDPKWESMVNQTTARSLLN